MTPECMRSNLCKDDTLNIVLKTAITMQKTCCYLFADDNTFFYVRHRPMTPADRTCFSSITHASILW